MRRSFRQNWLASCCLGVAAIGCQSAEEQPPGPATAAISAPNAPDSPTPEPAPQEPTGAGTNDPSDSTVPAAVATYSPPFPERLELFEPPKRSQSAIRQDDVEGQSVELKGFVHVDEPRVLLAIDGVISSIAEGGEKHGVQVKSIQPPSVVLQRGRSRWTATLE